MVSHGQLGTPVILGSRAVNFVYPVEKMTTGTACLSIDSTARMPDSTGLNSQLLIDWDRAA
jgi:hypothetical protein